MWIKVGTNNWFQITSRGFPPTQTPTQKLKIEFSQLSPHEIGSSLVSFLMIFKALQPDLFRLMFHALSSKVPKIPEFSLTIPYGVYGLDIVDFYL